jgi:hypothetical protein
MMSRFDLQMVRQASSLLQLLRTDHAIRLELASNPPLFNIDTLLLAQQVDWINLWTIDVREVVYDVTRGKTPEYSEHQLRTADFVLIVWPYEIPPAAEIFNHFESRFLAIARACGRQIANAPGPPNTLLFDMHGSPCQTLDAKPE